MPDYQVDLEGQSFKVSIPDEAGEAQGAREAAASRLQSGTMRGAVTRPTPEVPHDYQTWGNLAEATAQNYPHPPADIKDVPQWMRENPQEVASIGMGGVTARAPIGPRQIRSHLDELEAQHRAGTISADQLAQARQRLGLPAQSAVRPISAAPAPQRPNLLAPIHRENTQAAVARTSAGRQIEPSPRTVGELRAASSQTPAQQLARPAIVRTLAEMRGPVQRQGVLGGDAIPRGYFKQWVEDKGIPEQQFANQYFAGSYSPGVRFETVLDSKHGRGLDFDGSLVQPGTNKFLGSIHRQIYPDKGLAYHQMLSLEARQQGGGFVKKLTAGQFDIYQKIGVERVELFANIDVGSYAWAKYGWLPTEWKGDPQWGIGSYINRRMFRLFEVGQLDKETSRAVESLLRNPDPRAMWAIADLQQPVTSPKFGPTTLGKALLIDNAWNGHFDLTNADQMARFNAYIRK